MDRVGSSFLVSQLFQDDMRRTYTSKDGYARTAKPFTRVRVPTWPPLQALISHFIIDRLCRCRTSCGVRFARCGHRVCPGLAGNPRFRPDGIVFASAKGCSSQQSSAGEHVGEIVRFTPKSELERARLIAEARAIYDSIFPPAAPDRAQQNDEDSVKN